MRWWRAKGTEMLCGVYAFGGGGIKADFQQYLDRNSVAMRGFWYAGPVDMPLPSSILPPLPDFEMPECAKAVSENWQWMVYDNCWSVHEKRPYREKLFWRNTGYYSSAVDSILNIPPHPEPKNSLHRRRDDLGWEPVE